MIWNLPLALDSNSRGFVLPCFPGFNTIYYQFGFIRESQWYNFIINWNSTSSLVGKSLGKYKPRCYHFAKETI